MISANVITVSYNIRWNDYNDNVVFTCTKVTEPNGVVIGESCASSDINMCCIRDSLPSSGICQGMWSPLYTKFSENGTASILACFNTLDSYDYRICYFKYLIFNSSKQYQMGPILLAHFINTALLINKMILKIVWMYLLFLHATKHFCYLL